MANRELDLDAGNLHLEFTRTADDTGGELHEMRARYAPRSSWPPPHRHPRQEERFEVLEGALLFRIGGRERRITAGQDLTLPPGTVHQARNDGDAPAVVIWQTRPALRTAEYFAAMAAAQARGTLLDQALVADSFTDVFSMPARSPTAIAVRVLALAARLLRRRPPLPV